MTGHHLPYEPVPDGPFHMDVQGLFVDHVNLRAAVLDSPAGRIPVLILDFSSSASVSPLPPIIYASTAEGLERLREIVTDSINAALAAARKS